MPSILKGGTIFFKCYIIPQQRCLDLYLFMVITVTLTLWQGFFVPVLLKCLPISYLTCTHLNFLNVFCIHLLSDFVAHLPFLEHSIINFLNNQDENLKL